MGQRTDETYENGKLVDTVQTAIPDTTVNRDLIETKALAALKTNADFLAVGAPSNVQVVAQVNALTRECSAVIRLLLGLVDSTTGT